MPWWDPRKERIVFPILAALGGALACHGAPAASAGAPGAQPGTTIAAQTDANRATIPTEPTAKPEIVAEDAEPVVVVSAPETLRALEDRGFDLGSRLDGHPARSAHELAAHPRYRVLRAAVAADLDADRRRDPRAGVGMRHAHRQFDATWLGSEKTRFDLIAVVNRIDRRVFAPEHCGELRFVYRLAYATDTPTGPVSSRLPMTVNVAHYLPRGADATCQDTARAWLRPRAATDEVAWLTADTGPLAPARVSALRLKSVELNFQSVRWPSTVRPQLGGHAEYVLRVFHPLDDAPFLKPARLENTLDAPRLNADRRLRAELRELLLQPDSLRALEAGTLVIPEKYLAERAVSVSPHGMERAANRPASAVFTPADFATIEFDARSSVPSAMALLRRLDGLSCPGCHQSRSLAGFHLLGEDARDKQVDALAIPMSAHFHAEVPRRRAYVAALAAGQPPDEARPHAERAPHDDGVGARCGLPGSAYAAWTCAEGLTCVDTGGELGTCQRASEPSVGDPCEYGLITRAPAHRDTARLARTPCADGRVCERNAVGFPGGMCAGGCDALPEGAVCGGIPLLVEFNACLASGRSFDACVLENTRPGALRACSFHEPCRDDYVCARVAGGGACMPPYFLFQLRVDGHPI